MILTDILYAGGSKPNASTGGGGGTGGAVDSVNGKQGAVVLTGADLNISSSDTTKISDVVTTLDGDITELGEQVSSIQQTVNSIPSTYATQEALDALDTSIGGETETLSNDVEELGEQVSSIQQTVNSIPSTYVKSTDLATVATTGSYNDLTDKPEISGGSDLSFKQTFNDLSTVKGGYPGNTLNLYTGSKLYFPNGVNGNFNTLDEIEYNYTGVISTINSLNIASLLTDGFTYDIVLEGKSGSSSLVAYKRKGAVYVSDDEATNHTARYTETNCIYYNTSTGKMQKSTDGGVTFNDADISLPVAQIYNGACTFWKSFGVLGNMCYVLPGVNGTYPNGFDNEGKPVFNSWTLNNFIYWFYDTNLSGAGYFYTNGSPSKSKVSSLSNSFIYNVSSNSLNLNGTFIASLSYDNYGFIENVQTLGKISAIPSYEDLDRCYMAVSGNVTLTTLASSFKNLYLLSSDINHFEPENIDLRFDKPMIGSNIDSIRSAKSGTVHVKYIANLGNFLSGNITLQCTVNGAAVPSQIYQYEAGIYNISCDFYTKVTGNDQIRIQAKATTESSVTYAPANVIIYAEYL